jgi:hypothetical protein
MENVLEEARVGRGAGLNSAVPAGTVVYLLLTRQFLPGYFEPPLPGLERGCRRGNRECCKTAYSSESCLRLGRVH